MTTFTNLNYCVYVLISLSDGNFYVGLTDNLKRRLTQHFAGSPRRQLHGVRSGLSTVSTTCPRRMPNAVRSI